MLRTTISTENIGGFGIVLGAPVFSCWGDMFLFFSGLAFWLSWLWFKSHERFEPSQ